MSIKVFLLKLRMGLLGILTGAIEEDPPSTPAAVQVVASGLSALVEKGSELSSSAQVLLTTRCIHLKDKNKFLDLVSVYLQEKASLVFVKLSSSLLTLNVNKSNQDEVTSAASIMVEGASNILDVSNNVSRSPLT